MASFDVNFQANTSGDHYVGYATYTEQPTPYTYTIITVNVVTPGAQSVTIDVPENLYCADQDVRYRGFVVAECQLLEPAYLVANGEAHPDDDTVGPPDNIPDSAITWFVDLVQQTDPCIKTDITCDNVGVLSVTMTSNGGGYAGPPTVTFTGGAPDATGTAVMGLGIITALNLNLTGGGGGYTPGSSVVGAPVLGGTGVGATYDATIDGGGIMIALSINAGGTGYLDSDVITLDETGLGGPGAPLATFTFDVVGVDEVASVTMLTPGDGYTAPAVVTFGAGGPTATGTAVMAPCPTLDLGLHECAGQDNVSATPDYDLELGESVQICADDSTLGALGTNFTSAPVAAAGDPDGNCHCAECKQVSISVPGFTGGAGKITYQTCWDGTNPIDTAPAAVTLVSQTIDSASTIDLGCIIPSTLVIDNGTLTGGVITPVESPC